MCLGEVIIEWLLHSWDMQEKTPHVCGVSPHVHTLHCRSQGQRQEESGSDGNHSGLSWRCVHSGCSLTTSLPFLGLAEGWGQHQGSAMEALVPAPVGEGHQLLDPVQSLCLHCIYVSLHGHCYFCFLEIKLKLADIQPFALVLWQWAAELRYEHCSFWSHSLPHYSLAVQSTTDRTSFLGLYLDASSWVLLPVERVLIHPPQLCKSQWCGCTNWHKHSSLRERVSNRNSTAQDPPHTDAGTLPWKRGHPCQVPDLRERLSSLNHWV